MQDLKPQRAVKSDSSWHFVGAQCDGAHPLDHGQSSPVLFPRAVGVATLTVSLFGVKALTFSRLKVVQAGNLTSICALSRCPFFFSDSATSEIYTLSLHDALPIISGTR